MRLRRCGALPASLFAAMLLDGMTSSLQARATPPLRGRQRPVRRHGHRRRPSPGPAGRAGRHPRAVAAAFAASYSELGGDDVAAAMRVALPLSPRPQLYYPLSMLATLGVLVGWGLINSLVVAVVTRHLDC